MGLTDGPDLDNLRESLAVAITSQLARSGEERVLVADPHLDTLPEELVPFAEFGFAKRKESRSEGGYNCRSRSPYGVQKISREALMYPMVIDTTGLNTDFYVQMSIIPRVA